MAEVVRPVRFLNVPSAPGLRSPFLLDGGTAETTAEGLVGLAGIALSLPRGIRCGKHYGAGTGQSSELLRFDVVIGWSRLPAHVESDHPIRRVPAAARVSRNRPVPR